MITLRRECATSKSQQLANSRRIPPVMIISTSFYVNTLAQRYQFARDSNHFTQIYYLEIFITGQFPLYHHLHLLPTRLLGYAVKNPEGFFPIKFIASAYYQLAASKPPELSQSHRIRR